MPKKSTAKQKARSAQHSAPVDDGVDAARELNGAVEATGAEQGPAGIVTWPTEYGNPDMAIPPATPVAIHPADGLAVTVTRPDDVPDRQTDEQSAEDRDDAEA